MVETWPNGPGKMNSSCDLPFHVLNVDALDFKTNPDVDFVTKKDHAKWAVSFRSTNTMTGKIDYIHLLTYDKKCMDVFLQISTLDMIWHNIF